MSKAQEVLKKVFGYDSFRGRQAEVIESVLAKKDNFVLMPTGAGKSICYQVPALLLEGVTIVISPLIALMQDQVLGLRELGVNAAAINSNTGSSNYSTIEAMQQGKIDLVYVSPERLLSEDFFTMLQNCPINLFAIDEAHCVSSWGHDFRPEYAKLHILNEYFPNIPKIALTATADTATRRDIKEKLFSTEREVKEFVTGFDRPNIEYQIIYKDTPKKQLLNFLNTEQKGNSGIVYCISKKKVDDVAAFLQKEGYNAFPYHAGLSRDIREKNQGKFISEENIIIVATIAFGMGIDKPNVRFVAHLDLPKTIENYYQETGRAGRDGLAAKAWMAYGMQDVGLLQTFISNSNAPEKQKYVERQKLNALLGICETSRCRRQVLLEYFGDKSDACGNCDICLNPPATIDGKEPAQKILSAIYRTGQLFGAAHIIDVLLGKETERMKQFGHNNLPTFGVGTEYDKKQWNSFIRQLVSHNILVIDILNHGSIKFTENSKAILKGEKEIKFVYQEKAKGGSKRVEKISSELTSLSTTDRSLFAKLKDLRLEMAKKANIPPYIILHDSTLIALAKFKPKNKEELLNISGFGSRKIEKYGDVFLKGLR